MTQEEITAAINAVLALQPSHIVWATANEQQRAEQNKQEKVFRQACERLPKQIGRADSNDLFDVLFPLACSQFNPPESLPALPAHLLLCLKPRCSLTCTKAIRRVSRSEWDPSLEEVPWYIASCSGTEAIYRSLDELEAEDDIQEFRKMRDTWIADLAELLPTLSLSKYLEADEKMPRHPVEARLDVIRYWTDILVKDQKGIFENWHPFWWRSEEKTGG